VAVTLALAPLGCTKGSASSGAEPVSSAAPSATVILEAAAPTSVETWTGSYDSQPGSLYVYDGGEWAGVTWRGDEAGTAIGSGTLTLAVNKKSGEVQGTADGAIGSVVLVGSIASDKVTATVARKDPSDRGLTGTLFGTLAGTTLSGSMRLSAPDARVIRDAKFTLSTGKP
jgi:hypothetical protein